MAISKINSLALGSVAKVNSLLKASMAKINSLVNVLFANEYSIDFDGTNDYLTIHGAGGLWEGGAAGSVSCWFKLDTVSSSRHLYRFQVDSSNYLRCFYHASQNNLRAIHYGNGTNVVATSNQTVENNGWHHLVHTWSEGADANIIYVDNNAVSASGLGTLTDESGEGFQMFIGSNQGTANYWKGNVDEFAIFDDVLSAGEVGTIYNSGTPTDISSHSGLIGYWRFENNANDSSSNSNVVTLVNDVSYTSEEYAGQ